MGIFIKAEVLIFIAKYLCKLCGSEKWKFLDEAIRVFMYLLSTWLIIIKFYKNIWPFFLYVY